MSTNTRRPNPAPLAGVSRILLCLLFTLILLVPTQPARARLWAHKLSGVLPAGASIDALESTHEISPDSQWVVYTVRGDPAGSEDLYSVPIHGGTPTRLTLPGFNGRMIYQFIISPDSSRVVYLADAYLNDKIELFSVSIEGGAAPQRISSGLMIPDGDVSFYFYITPLSDRVVYRADQEVNEQFNLYSVPIGGGTITRISHDLAANSDVINYHNTPDGEWMVFQTVNADTHLSQLFFTPIDERNVRRLDGGLAAGINFRTFTVLPDSSGIVYAAYQESSTAIDLYRADLYTGPTQPPPVRLTDAPDPSSMEGTLWVTSDGQFAVFIAVYAPGDAY